MPMQVRDLAGEFTDFLGYAHHVFQRRKVTLFELRDVRVDIAL